MYCRKCPSNHPMVMRFDVACKGNCGKLIKWYASYCTDCSDKLLKCEECGS